MRPERNCLIGIMIFLSLCCATCQVDGSGQDLDAQLYLPMNGADGSTAILNEGSGSHVFTASGNTQIDTSQFQFGGTSLQFDGTGDFADTPDHANFDLSGGIWTVDFWARFTQLVTDNCIFSQSTTVDTDYFLIYTSGTALGFAVVAGGAVAVSKSTGNLVVDRWYHFAIVENGNAYQVWVDGKKAASITYDSDRPANYTSVATIGKNIGTSGGGEKYMTGWIDGFRFSKGVVRYKVDDGFRSRASRYTTGDTGIMSFQNDF